MADVVGVVFHNGNKTYYFDPAGLELARGDRVVVQTSKGSGDRPGGRADPPRRRLRACLLRSRRSCAWRRAKISEAQACSQYLRKEAMTTCREMIASPRPRHEAGERRYLLRRREDHLQLLLRRAGGFPLAGGRSVQGPQDAHRTAAGRSPRRGAHGRGAGPLRPAPLLHALPRGRRAGLHPHGQGAEPAAQSQSRSRACAAVSCAASSTSRSSTCASARRPRREGRR